MAKPHISIYSALAANILIVATKFTAGALTHSSSMISEGIHTLIDTSNELLLLYGLKKSRKPRDESHPWGYGHELYFWSFMVSILIFGLGGGISIYQGLQHILHPVKIDNPKWNYIVLGLSFLFESISLFISAREFNKTRSGLSWWAALIKSKDPANFIVLVEDVGDMLGLIIVFISLICIQIFKNPYLDGIASVLVGLLLVAVSVIVARECRSLLMGEGITTETRNKIIAEVEGDETVIRVLELFSTYQSPEEIVVMLTVAFKPDLDTENINNAIKRITGKIKSALRLIKFVIIQPKAEEETPNSFL
jgi:cation diffusion facilitator family transporter